MDSDGTRSLMPFSGRLRVAAEEGILWGVKLALAAAILLLSVSYLVGDYNIVRERAWNGQRAFDYLQGAHGTAQTDTPPPRPQERP